uniref:SSD domain-containing protein n=1 Tax=Panagrellus redivivus TaxID=6233 RepID=A0A7E4VZR4_PANRE
MLTLVEKPGKPGTDDQGRSRSSDLINYGADNGNFDYEYYEAMAPEPLDLTTRIDRFLIGRSNSSNYSSKWKRDFEQRPTWCDADLSLQAIKRGAATGNRAALYSRSFIQNCLYNLGCFIQHHGIVVLLFVCALFSMCCYGLQYVRIETDIVKLWVSEGGRLDAELHYFQHVQDQYANETWTGEQDKYFLREDSDPLLKQRPQDEGSGQGFQVLIQTANEPDENLLTKEGLTRHVDLLQHLVDLKVDKYGVLDMLKPDVAMSIIRAYQAERRFDLIIGGFDFFTLIASLDLSRFLRDPRAFGIHIFALIADPALLSQYFIGDLFDGTVGKCRNRPNGEKKVVLSKKFNKIFGKMCIFGGGCTMRPDQRDIWLTQVRNGLNGRGDSVHRKQDSVKFPKPVYLNGIRHVPPFADLSQFVFDEETSEDEDESTACEVARKSTARKSISPEPIYHTPNAQISISTNSIAVDPTIRYNIYADSNAPEPNLRKSISADSNAPEPNLRKSISAESSVPDHTRHVSISAESIDPDQTRRVSISAESIVRDPVVRPSVVRESVMRESFVRESVIRESIFPNDTRQTVDRATKNIKTEKEEKVHKNSRKRTKKDPPAVPPTTRKLRRRG